MWIPSLDSSPFFSFPQQVAAGDSKTATYPLSLYRGTVKGLPASLDALLVASDLQGVAPVAARGEVGLVGEALAGHLVDLAARREIPPLDRVGVVLAGDLYSSPGADERGASGDVRPVWRAFGRHPWVAGVAGNHDTFGDTEAERARFSQEPKIVFLDGTLRGLDGLTVAGVGGIIGNPKKPRRRKESQFLGAVERLLQQRPSLLVLHHGPDVERGGLRGHPAIRRVLEAHQGELLVVCGHVYWPTPLADLSSDVQVLNADGRVVLLERAP